MFKKLGQKLSKGATDSPVQQRQSAVQPRATPYPAQPLQDPDAEFRLLTIRPGRQDQQVECELSPASFRNQLPSYEAISSTPGPSPKDWQVVVNAQPYPVTEHINASLRTFRHESHNRFVWLEALCVNIDDQLEKAAQAQLKAYIFGYAHSTIIWLGTGTLNTLETFRVIQRHVETTKASLPSGLDWNDAYGRAIVKHFSSEILSRKWWSWASSVPEATLSRTVLIQCGSSQATWEDFMQMWTIIRGQSNELSSLLSNRYLASIQEIKTAYALGHRQDLTQLLLRLSSFEATDFRDRIAAALSVRERNTNQIAPKIAYTRQLQDLQVDIANACLELDRSLEFLSLSGIRDTSASSTFSWLPELSYPQPAWKPRDLLTQSSYSNLITAVPSSAPSRPASQIQTQTHPFHASGSPPLSPRATITLSPGSHTPIFTATGLPVDTITHTPSTPIGRSTPSLLKTYEIVLSYIFGTLEPFQSLTDRWTTRMLPRVLNPDRKRGQAEYVECLVDGNVEHCELRRELFRKARDKLLESVPAFDPIRGPMRHRYDDGERRGSATIAGGRASSGKPTSPHGATAEQISRNRLVPEVPAIQEAYFRTILTDRPSLSFSGPSSTTTTIADQSNPRLTPAYLRCAMSPSLEIASQSHSDSLAGLPPPQPGTHAFVSQAEAKTLSAALLAALLPHLPEPQRYTTFRDDFLAALEAALQFRTLFVTRSGFLGLGPTGVKGGDVVAVLLGCGVPLVLRPEGGGAGGGRAVGHKYRVVGECYVHGLMDGEGVGYAGWEGDCVTFELV